MLQTLFAVTFGVAFGLLLYDGAKALIAELVAGWHERPDQLPDATDDAPEPEQLSTGHSIEPPPFVATLRVVHRASCEHAARAVPIQAYTEAAAYHWAQASDPVLAPCLHCRPYTTYDDNPLLDVPAAPALAGVTGEP